MSQLRIAKGLILAHFSLVAIFAVATVFYVTSEDSMTKGLALVHLILFISIPVLAILRRTWKLELCTQCSKWILPWKFLRLNPYVCPFCGNTALRPWPWDAQRNSK